MCMKGCGLKDVFGESNAEHQLLISAIVYEIINYKCQKNH